MHEHVNGIKKNKFISLWKRLPNYLAFQTIECQINGSVLYSVINMWKTLYVDKTEPKCDHVIYSPSVHSPLLVIVNEVTSGHKIS